MFSCRTYGGLPMTISNPRLSSEKISTKAMSQTNGEVGAFRESAPCLYKTVVVYGQHLNLFAPFYFLAFEFLAELSHQLSLQS